MNVWTLEPGQAIRVVKTFKDVGGNTVEAGTILHFEKRDFLPYHDGHTVYFKEVTLYLCGLDDTGAIVENYGNEFYEPLVPPPNLKRKRYVANLKRGQAIRVLKTFQDNKGKTIVAGTILHFHQHYFEDHTEVHTVQFVEANLYFCDRNETGLIADNEANEFFELYVPAPPRPLPPVVVAPPIPVVIPKMPHMRFADMFMNLRVVVVQPFKGSTGYTIAADGVEMQFLQFNGTAYCFLRGSICLDPNDPILENAGNAWLRPVPTLDSLNSCLEHLWNHGLTPISEAAKQCQAWLNQPSPRPKPPEFPSENLPFAEAFLIEGLKYV